MWFILPLMFSCADQKLNYKCTCTKISYNINDDGEDLDDSFSENICDTYENIEGAFDINGSLYNALEECREELSELSSDYECECDCTYQSEC
jgi:hypothetical protein